MQTKDVLETCIQQSEKAQAAKTVGGQSPDDVDWHAVLSELRLTERQANALAEVRNSMQASIDSGCQLGCRRPSEDIGLLATVATA